MCTAIAAIVDDKGQGGMNDETYELLNYIVGVFAAKQCEEALEWVASQLRSDSCPALILALSGEKNWGVVLNRHADADDGTKALVQDAEKAITGFIELARDRLETIRAPAIETFAQQVDAYCQNLECSSVNMGLFFKVHFGKCKVALQAI
jgi:hypothetical protein